MSNSTSSRASFHGFNLNRLLGVGATAEVFSAGNLSTGRNVALKIFSSIVSHDQELVDRLKAEAEILERLRHPNVVATFGVQQHDGLFAIELELVEGVDLRKWMEKHQNLLPLFEPSLWIVAQIARGLGAAHEIGALHRDLKPENILISNQGDVKITDFGLARTVTRMTMTRVGLLVGSLGYLAPEVVNGERATPQSDLFSLGVMAYELLVGRPPFVGETPQALIQKITTGVFTPTCEAAPHLPLDVGRILDSCLNRDPERRPRSVWEVEAVIMTALSSGPLLRFAKTLVASTLIATNGEDIATCLQLKRDWLLTHSNPQNRASTLAEFHRLFPHDASIAELIQQTDSNTDHVQRRRTQVRWAFAAVAAGLIGVAFQNFDRCSSTDIKVAAPAAPVPVAAETPAPSEIATSKPAPPLTKIKKTNGTLSFEVPDDVQVYVGDVLVPRNELSAYKIAAGRYPMRMVKEGFLPIESTVIVKAGRVAVIRAGGAL